MVCDPRGDVVMVGPRGSRHHHDVGHGSPAAVTVVPTVLEAAVFPAAVLDAGCAIVVDAITLHDDGVIVSHDAMIEVVGGGDSRNRKTRESTENHDNLLEREHDPISCFQRNPLMTGHRASGMPGGGPRKH
jgi:hypothetical protein